jgi:predicted negative regulator of RcsB-dependent stress response
MKRFLSAVALLAAASALPLSAADSLPPITVSGYVIDAQILPATHTLTAQARVTFTANQASDAAVFELHGALRVTQVLDAAGTALNGERGSGDTVRVTPAQGLVAGQTYTWTFTYSGQLAGADGGPVEGLKLASIDDPISYLLYAGRWFPMVGYTTDRFTAQMHVFVPAGYTVIGSGATRGESGAVTTVSAEQARREATPAAGTSATNGPQLVRRGDAVGEAPTNATEARVKNGTEKEAEQDRATQTPLMRRRQEAAARRAARQQAKAAAAQQVAADKLSAAKTPPAAAATAALLPLPGGREFDFSWTKPGFPGTLIVGKFLPPVTEAGSPEIRVYTTEAHKASAAAYADTANGEFAFYTNTFGLPETPRLSIVELPDDTVPAAWAPEIAAIAGARLANKADYRLLANTMAHQWWGSEVSPATLSDTWITNGMARYGELLYLEDQAGQVALQKAVLDVSAGALAYDTIPLAHAGTLDPFTPQFQSMTLEKGAMVFHMLRWMVGDDSFLKIMHATLTQYADKGITTGDFEKLAESESQQQLTAFFSQWLDGTGAPDFVDNYSVYRLGNDKGFRTIGNVTQDLDLFNMPVDLRIETQGKTVNKRVDVEGDTSQYVVDTFGLPRSIEIDPDNWILKNSPDMQVRIAILKGQQLVGQGDLTDALVEYQKALVANPASSLASYRIGELLFTQRNYQAAVNAYRDALRGDGEPEWTQVFSHLAIGKIFDATGQRDRAINEYRLALQTNDNTAGALNEARALLRTPYKPPQ